MAQLGMGSTLALAVLLAAPSALARGGSYSSGSRHGWSSYSHPTSNRSSGSTYATRSHSATSTSATGHATRSASSAGVVRDSHGKIKRDPAQRRAFEAQHACPSTGRTSGACPGYVVDHVVPLKRGGKDAPSNMQWQSKEAAKDKDRWE